MLFFIATLGCKPYYSHFTDEETDMKKVFKMLRHETALG